MAEFPGSMGRTTARLSLMVVVTNSLIGTRYRELNEREAA
jgi:hypothetical protein